MKQRIKMPNPFLLAAQGFLVGALLFFGPLQEREESLSIAPSEARLNIESLDSGL